MLAYSEMNKEKLQKELESLKKEYGDICEKGISLTCLEENQVLKYL